MERPALRLAHGFAKLPYLAGLAAAGLLFMVFVVGGNVRSGSEFFGIWFLSTIFMGIAVLVIMGFLLNAGWIVKEFDNSLKRTWTARSDIDGWASVPTQVISPDKAFTGIYGQDDAIRIVQETITAAQGGLQTHPDGLLATFFFLGPTGVGKTELAQRVATFIRQPLVKFDMGDFVDRHAAFRFTGAPPG